LQSKKPASTCNSRDRPFDMTCNTTYNICQLLAYLSGFLSKTAKARLYPREHIIHTSVCVCV
jgi:hypothetical protein